ncbi:hypothetical protein [Roseomonas xinghualingensis]|uniref:hypothetical protein n=1 Tax=Roseomonas xinghualingensis TaxID=2986475 RepID=UPI0021F221CC|nr:hypothetical protein [Roseomonas sp. SXEYE001]MCV4206333.1 hypothetical protein [Roseomonas sp. SXEYE001]
MSVRLEGSVIRLEGECRAEDAEPLLSLLQEEAGRVVDLTSAVRLHTAVIQVLLALRPPLAGPAGDPFLARWLAPLLAATPPG